MTLAPVADGARLTGARRAVVMLAVALALWGWVTASASAATAHASLVSSSPADGSVLDTAPERVELTFSESVQVVDAGVRLFSAEDPSDDVTDLVAHVVDRTVVAPLPTTLATGTHVLSYRVISADGHPISGTISFSIGAATVGPAPSFAVATPADTRIASTVAVILTSTGVLAFGGLVVFRLLVLRRIDEDPPALGRLTTGAALAAVGGAVALVPLSALDAAGSGLLGIGSVTPWLDGVRGAPGIAAGMVIIGVLGAWIAVRSRSSGPLRRLVALVCALLALASPLLTGHTRIIEPLAVMMLADLGHLVAGAVWVGGVIGLLAYLVSYRDDAVAAAVVVTRFSTVALVSVIVLAASGIAMGVLVVGSVTALVTTGYGLTLIIKLGVVAAVVVFALVNRARLVPAIAARPTLRLQWSTLRLTLAYEAAALVAVLVVTGVLVGLNPGHDNHDDSRGVPSSITPETATVSLVGSAQQLAVDGTLGPATTGDNDLRFTLTYAGAPVDLDSVTVSLSMPEHDLGPIEAVATRDPTTGEFRTSVALPLAGVWEFQITARVSEFAAPVVTVAQVIR